MTKEEEVRESLTKMSMVCSAADGFGNETCRLGGAVFCGEEAISEASRKGLVLVGLIGAAEGLRAVGDTRVRKGLFEARTVGPRSMRGWQGQSLQYV